jgi:DNA polymerase-3 subunit epsilon
MAGNAKMQVMREIVLDTETTGLDPRAGHRIIEIGCVELINAIPSGQEFHRFINPQRDVPPEAEQIHGLSTRFLADKPLFADICDDFLSFIADATLIIHNASFDVGFLNAELALLDRPPIAAHRVVDTLALARRKHPAGPNSLDALCRRYGIDTTDRSKHGALIDSLLLAQVYVELIGGHQTRLGLENEIAFVAGSDMGDQRLVKPRPKPLPPRLSEDEREAHDRFVQALGPDALWKSHTEV